MILSVAAFWWTAWYFDTYVHLLVSVLVAPLVLLRSDESVALGVEMFSRYHGADELSLHSVKGVLAIVVATLAAGGASWLVSEWFLVGHEGWPLFWRSMLIGVLAMNVGMALAGAVAGAVAGAQAGVLAVAVAIAGMVALVGAVAGAGAVAGVLAGVLAVAGAVAVARARAATAAVTVAAVAALAGISVGTLIRAIATRFFASLRHIVKGVAAFQKNWQRTLFQIDLYHTPEMVPGVGEKIPDLNLGVMVEKTYSSNEISNKINIAITLPIIFILSLFYRYSLKSTCWLYLPLIYVAHLPGRLQDGEERKAWLMGHTSKIQSWASLVFAVGSLVFAELAYTDYGMFTDSQDTVQKYNLQAVPLTYLLVLDFSTFPIWHWFSLPAALLTVGLFFAINYLAVDIETRPKADVSGLHARTLIELSRLRNILVYIWIFITLYYFTETAYGMCKLPDWMTPWLEWYFGNLTCPASNN
ncbi:MAG: hypothetical protein GY761_04095 [Hyphomicrobiales bacterium]|nr:hypothetical protein [Hyphomicrobiales bacterium]